MSLKSERKRLKKLDSQMANKKLLDSYELLVQSSNSDIFLFETKNKEVAFAAERIVNTYRNGEYVVVLNTDTGSYWVCPKGWCKTKTTQCLFDLRRGREGMLLLSVG